MKKKTGGYPGPTLAKVHSLTDAQVEAAFKKLGLETSPLPWHEDDPGRNVARFAVRETPDEMQVNWSKSDLAKLKADAMVWHSRCERVRLFSAYLQTWTDTLDEAHLWDTFTDITGEKPSVSERRYTDVFKLRAKVVNAVYSQQTTKQEDQKET